MIDNCSYDEAAVQMEKRRFAIAMVRLNTCAQSGPVLPWVAAEERWY
jgi:hypothetical protein